MTYEQLRKRCLKMWGFHPDTKDSIYEMWAEINAHSGWRRNVAEPSAAMLLGELAEFADEHKDKK